MRINIYLAKELETKSPIKQQLASGILGKTELWVFCESFNRNLIVFLTTLIDMYSRHPHAPSALSFFT